MTVIVQCLPTASVDLQLLVWANSLAFVPVMVMPVIFSGALPLFFRRRIEGALVVFTAWGAKSRQGSERKTLGACVEPRRPKTSNSFWVLM